MPTGVQTTLINAAALQLDGAYVSEQVESQILPAGPNSGLVLIPGAANWGPIGQIRTCSKYDDCVPIHGDTQVTVTPGSPAVDYGLAVRVFEAAAAGASSFALTRVDDGTSASATGTLVDTSVTPSIIVNLTAMWHGTFGNRIKHQLALQSGSFTSGGYPVCRLTVFPPVGNPEVFSNIIAYGGGGTYAESTFQANLLAAVNGTNNTPPSRWIIASNGVVSANPPKIPTAPLTLSGGTDGTSGLTDSSIVGVDGPAGTRTGMYMFRNIAGAGTVILPGVSAYSTFASLDAFCQQETCIGVWGNFPIGTGTAAAVQAGATNSLSSPWIYKAMSWNQFADPATKVSRWLEPEAFVAGDIAGTLPWRYVGNKPRTGIPGISATEDTLSGIPLSTAEGGEREANGLGWIANPAPGGQPFALAHGMMSDGQTYSSDVRMANLISLNVQKILATVVGEMQGPGPNDRTRHAARAKVNEYMGTLAGKIVAYEDTLDQTNNSPVTIAQGQLLCALEVQTRAPVRFAIAAVQVGAAIQIQVTQLTQ